ncbi:MAG: hypothetical protein MHPSP_000490, partial [Paramarteilia canceri]
LKDFDMVIEKNILVEISMSAQYHIAELIKNFETKNQEDLIRKILKISQYANDPKMIASIIRNGTIKILMNLASKKW